MRGGQAVRNRRRDPDRLLPWKWRVTKSAAKRLALEQLGDEVDPRPFPSDVEDLQQAGVRNRRQSLPLALEADDRGVVLQEPLGQHLDGDISLQPAVAGAVDLPHATCTQRFQDLVWSQRRAGGE